MGNSIYWHPMCHHLQYKAIDAVIWFLSSRSKSTLNQKQTDLECACSTEEERSLLQLASSYPSACQLLQGCTGITQKFGL